MSRVNNRFQRAEWIRTMRILLLVLGQLSYSIAVPANDIQKGVTLDERTLVQLQVIFRHGHRTHERTYPKDPSKQLLEEMGLGQLTNIGKEQTYELGKFLRERYGKFLNSKYDPREVEARSSDKDRTIMSALCVLAGCYPPTNGQMWDSDLAWQPIPVRMTPIEIDYMLYAGPSTNCDRRNYVSDQAHTAFNNQNQEIHEFLTEVAEFNVTKAFDIQTIIESITLLKDYNITPPDWTRTIEDRMQTLEDITYVDFQLQMPDQNTKYLGVGSLVGEIVHNMMNKTLFGDVDHNQLSLYSTHDTVIYGFMSLLGVYNNLPPPLASAILIEQHKNDDGNYYVRMLFRNDTTKEPIELRMSNCLSHPCSLKEFVIITDPLIPKNIVLECRMTQSSENEIGSTISSGLSIGQSIGILFGAALALALVIAIVVMRNRRSIRSRQGYTRLDLS